MRKVVVIMALLLAIGVVQYRTAESKCCPPPPQTTGPVRTLPRSDRTTPPNTNITLPPQTSMQITTMTAPGGSTGGPVTQTTNGGQSRNTITYSGGLSTNNSNRTNALSTMVRSSGSTQTNTNTRSAVSGSNAQVSTEVPTMPSLPGLSGTSASPIDVEEFSWEDWWGANTGYLLASYQLTGESAYRLADVTLKDIPSLLTLSSYRGLFDQGISEMVLRNLSSLGMKEVVPILAKIAEGKYKFEEGQKASYVSSQDYEWMAIRALGYLKDTSGADAVASVLLRDLAVIPSAAVANATEKIITDALKDNTKQKRYWACFALGEIGNKEYLTILRKVLLEDGDMFVKIAAAQAIAKVGGSSAVDALKEGFDKSKAYYQSRAFIAGALGYLGAADPVEDIHLACVSSNGDVRIAGAWALAYVIGNRMENKKQYADLLEEYFTLIKKESDDVVRRDMTMGLLFMPVHKMLEVLTPFLADQRSNDVKKITALACGFSGSPDTAELITSLQDVPSDPGVAKARAYALAMLATGESKKLALDMLNESTDQVLIASGILHLAKTNGDSIFRSLDDFQRHKSDDNLVLRTVSFCFPAYLGDSGFSVATRFVRSREDAKSSMTYIGLGLLNTQNALDLISKFGTSDKEVGKCVAISKGLMGGLPLISSLETALSDAKEQVRSAAAVALGSLNRPEEIQRLITIAEKDSHEKARAYALLGLSNVKIPVAMEGKVVDSIVKILKEDKKYMVRANAALILSRFPNSRIAFDAVREATKDKEKDVKAMAAISLGLMGNSEAAKDIKIVMEDGRGTPLGWSAYIAFGLMNYKPMLDRFILDFEYAQDEEYLLLGFAIAKMADSETYLKMLDYLKNDDVYVRENAVKTLAMFDKLSEEQRKEVIEKLKPLSNDRDYTIRFYSSITRYNLGDKEALLEALKIVNDNKFYMPGTVDIEYNTAMDLVNDSMPMFYKVKAYIWGTDDAAVN